MGAGTAAVMIFLSQNGNVVERYESRVYTDGLYQGELFAQNLCVSSDGDVALDGMQDDSALHGAGLFNMEDKEVVYGYHLYDRLYPASTTKILTAYIALKYGNMDDKVTVSANQQILTGTNRYADSGLEILYQCMIWYAVFFFIQEMMRLSRLPNIYRAVKKLLLN